MCGSGATRHNRSGGPYPSSKVTSLWSRNQEVVFALSSSRVKMPRNPVMLGLGAVASILAMMSQVYYTGARVGAGWEVGMLRACARVVGNAGSGAGGNVSAPCCMVPVVTAWVACVGAGLSGAACLVLYWGRCRSLSAWTCKRATEDTRALMLPRICSILLDPATGASCPNLSAENSWSSSSSSYPYFLALASEPGCIWHWDPPL